MHHPEPHDPVRGPAAPSLTAAQRSVENRRAQHLERRRAVGVLCGRWGVRVRGIRSVYDQRMVADRCTVGIRPAYGC